MQLYAKTTPTTTKNSPKTLISADLISADQAKRQCDYFCPECGAIVRLRAGEQRLKHFYHLAKSTHCRQQNKSLEHIQTQRRIQEQIGSLRCALEVGFPAINRIADVVWEEEKLIFEVQCSPMTASEARSRIADYARAGYTVVFILHDKRFNQYRLSALEATLKGTCFYFSDISAQGVGMLYDQFDQIANGLRIKRLAKLPIRIDQPMRLSSVENSLESSMKGEEIVIELFREGFRRSIKQKKPKQKNPLLYFQGDLIDKARTDSESRDVVEALQLCQASEGGESDMVSHPRPRKESYFSYGFLRDFLRHMMYEITSQASKILRLLWRHLLERSGSK